MKVLGLGAAFAWAVTLAPNGSSAWAETAGFAKLYGAWKIVQVYELDPQQYPYPAPEAEPRRALLNKSATVSERAITLPWFACVDGTVSETKTGLDRQLELFAGVSPKMLLGEKGAKRTFRKVYSIRCETNLGEDGRPLTVHDTWYINVVNAHKIEMPFYSGSYLVLSRED